MEKQRGQGNRLTLSVLKSLPWVSIPGGNWADPSSDQAWAVGDFFNSSGNDQTLTEQWNGTAWSVVTSPNPSTSENILDAAAADQSSGQAWAVGAFFNTTNNVLETLTEFNP